MLKTINIGIIGFGIVGSGAAKILLMNQVDIEKRVGAVINIKKLADLDIITDRKIGYDLSDRLTTDAWEIINDPEIDIVVETIGGIRPAGDFIRAAINNGKSVVTANKELIAKQGEDILPLAKEHKVDFMFEASVGGGIPIVAPLKTSLAGNKINEIIGIVNGTTNYILTRMKNEGLAYDVVLKDAQAKGYAESNPTSDVDGFDSAYKISILSSLAFNSRSHTEEVYREGIRDITDADIKNAEEMGYTIKLLALASETAEGKIMARVHPTLVPHEHPLSTVNGVMNAVFVKANGVNETMYYGPGAGSLAAGSAIVGDIIDVARNIISGSLARVACTCYYDKEMVGIEQLEVSNYIRIIAVDKPGCIAAISRVFADYNVSLASIIQKDTKDGIAEIIWLTHKSAESQINAALKDIAVLPVVNKIASRIRVL